MELDNVTDTTDTSATENQETGSETPAATGIETPTPGAQVKGPTEAAIPSTEVVNAPPQMPVYSPDFKYKANNQVKELDPRLHAIIKDKETEEWVKDVVSRAEGLDSVKADREQIRAHFSNLQTEAQKVIGAVDQGNYGGALQMLGVDTNNVGAVMQGLGFKKRDILEYAVTLANLTPEQEQSYARQRELELQGRQQQTHAQVLEQRLQEADVRWRSLELKSTLSTPEYASIVQAYDQSNGQGAFWNYVCERGDYWHQKGVEKSVSDVVAEVAKMFKPFITAPAHAQSPQATAAKAPGQVPVIPTAGSGSASPARKKTTNLAAMKAFAANLED